MSEEKWDAMAAVDPINVDIQQQWSKYNHAQYVIDLCEFICGTKGATNKNAKTGKRKPFNVVVKTKKEEATDKFREEDEDDEDDEIAPAWETREDALRGNIENVEGSEPKRLKSLQDTVKDFVTCAMSAFHSGSPSALVSTSSVGSEQQ